MLELHIPEGINYECAGCGKCCSGWTVPLTQEDYDRISAKDWGTINPDFQGKNLIRELKDYEKADTPYSHAMVKGEDGFCQFLVNNLCYIHGQFGSKFKPAMCQLFPYSFNETPTGIFTTVSFYSEAAVYNKGKSLVEQKALLEQKYQEFQSLYPDHHPNWSSLKFIVGQPMDWNEYLRHEAVLIDCLQDQSLAFEDRMLKGSDYLMAHLALKPRAPGPDAPNTIESKNTTTRMKKLDKHLLVALHKIYFPVKALGRGEGDFNVGRFFCQLAFQGTRLAFPGQSFPMEKLHEFPWPVRDPEIENLLYRYFFSRLFGKLYFGAGFGQLSLVTGFHHLVLVLALVKLQSKASAITRDAPIVSFIDVAATVRLLEKRLGESKLGGYEAALWELLMPSPQRVKRVMAAV